MKKSMIAGVPGGTRPNVGGDWLDLEEIASVEVTSEDPQYPVESALVEGAGPGWRAGESGRQIIRLLFSEPQRIRRIHLEFVETEVSRTQEFTLRWASSSGGSANEIVRQQWNFSPTGSMREAEDFQVALESVSLLELTITPDVSGGNARASLAQCRVA